MNFFKAKLGELLINAEALTQEELDQALEAQKESGLRLGEQLITSGFITETQLCKALQSQLRIEYFDLQDFSIDPDLITLIPEELAVRGKLIPLSREGNVLKIAVSDPMDYASVRDVEITTGLMVQICISEPSRIQEKIKNSYTNQKVMDAAKTMVAEEAEAQLEEEDEDQPIIRFVNNMFEQAISSKASDIHIEPGPKKMLVRFRIDGKLQLMQDPGMEIFASVCSRIKFIGNMSIAEKRVPQDGRAAYNYNGKNVDMRLSTLPSVFGEKIVIRITTSLTFNLSVENLGMSQHNQAAYERLIHKPFGIILVTGPTGSGKSTTLYTALNEIRRPEINLITVENPVEMLVPEITQVNINPEQGLTFAAVLRSVLRQDPDVVMIGEIRDGETAEIATAMSITGHLVFSTLHTYDAPSSIVRLVDMGIKPFMVASSVIGVISQRLLRKLCDKCKEPYLASPEEKILLKIDPSEDVVLYRPKGCPECKNVGFKGRTAVGEIMELDSDLRDAINADASSDRLRDIALRNGMVPMVDDVRNAIINGKSAIQEAAHLVDLTE